MNIITSKKYHSLTEEQRSEYLVKYLNHSLQSSIKKTQSSDNYGLPGWPYMQAEQLGCQKTINKLLKLVSND